MAEEVAAIQPTQTKKVYLSDTQFPEDTSVKGSENIEIFEDKQNKSSDMSDFPDLKIKKADNDISKKLFVAEKIKTTGLTSFISGLVLFFGSLGSNFACEPKFNKFSQKLLPIGAFLGVAGLIVAFGAKWYSEHIQKNK